MLVYLRDGGWLLNVSGVSHASVSQGRICSENCTCCHTEKLQIKLSTSPSHNTDTGPTSPSADPTTPGAWQGSRWSANFEVTGMTGPGKRKTWGLGQTHIAGSCHTSDPKTGPLVAVLPDRSGAGPGWPGVSILIDSRFITFLTM